MRVCFIIYISSIFKIYFLEKFLCCKVSHRKKVRRMKTSTKLNCTYKYCNDLDIVIFMEEMHVTEHPVYSLNDRK